MYNFLVRYGRVRLTIIKLMIYNEDQLMGKCKKIFSFFNSFIVFFFSISNKADDTQSENTVKTNEEGLFVKRLRSLFPAIEIKVEHVRRKFEEFPQFQRVFYFYNRAKSQLAIQVYPTDYLFVLVQ